MTDRPGAWLAALAGFILAALWLVLSLSLIGRTNLGGSGSTREALFDVAIYAPLLAMALVGGRLNGLSILRPGRGSGVWLAIGAAMGVGGILIATGYAWIAGTLVTGSTPPIRPLLLLAGAGVILLQVLAEEAYFRGWLQPLLVRGAGRGAGVALTAVGFALLHGVGGALGPLSFANMVFGGLLFGRLAQAGGGIWPAVAAHFGWNAVEQLGLGLDPNPGLGGFGALLDLDLVGPARWGGGEEGLNASIGMAFALIALLAPLLLIRRTERQEAALAA